MTDELVVRDPGPGEAQVKVLASGICHSDLNVLDGTSPMTPPVVLGHEGAGVVVAVGAGTHHIGPGDTVMVGSMTPCWTCRACLRGRFSSCPQVFGRGTTPFRWQDQPVRVYANVSSFAGLITVQSSQLVPTYELDPRAAALVGCAVSTGYGVIRNVARVVPGDAIVVFGVGGIGVNALQTARSEGAARIVAVDINPAKADTARHFGADTFVCPPADTHAAGLVTWWAKPCRADRRRWSSAAGRRRPSTPPSSCPPRRNHRAGRDSPPGHPGRRGRRPAAAGPAGRRQPQRGHGSPPGPARDRSPGQRGPSSIWRPRSPGRWPLADIEAAIGAVRRGEVVRAVLDHSLGRRGRRPTMGGWRYPPPSRRS